MYNIIRNGDNPHFVALDSSDNIFLEIEGIQDLAQQGIALIATEEDGTYSIYLPHSYEKGNNVYIDPEIRAACIISGVTSYVYMYNMLILKKEDYYVFIRPDMYSLHIADEGVLRERAKNLYHLCTEELQIKHVLPNNNLIIQADDGLYLVEHSKDSEQALITQLENVTPITSNYVIATLADNLGEYILGCSEVFAKIVPFSPEENEKLQATLASVNPVYGCYCMNEENCILEVKLFFEGISFVYTLALDFPATTVELKSYNRVSDNFTISIWNVIFSDDPDEKLLIVTPKGRTTVKLEDLI
jgi:hypothetical protein